MRPDQERIAEWLSERALELTNVYKGALRLLDDLSFPGRQRFICHAARDIGNRAPEIIAEWTQIERVEMKDDLVALEELWTANRLDQLGLDYASAAAGDGSIALVRAELAVPYQVFRQVQAVVMLQRKVAENRRDKAIKMLETVAPENKGRQEILFPLAEQWMDVTGWFVAHTHAGHKARMIDEGEMQSNFLALETFLHTLIRGTFFGPMDTLDEILEDTNA